MKRLALYTIELVAAAVAVVDITLDELYWHISGDHIDEVMVRKPTSLPAIKVEADGEVVRGAG